MKKGIPLVKAIAVAIIMLVLGYIGLDVPKDTVTAVVDEYVPDTTETDTRSPLGAFAVASVIDGDTLTVDQNGAEFTVRVIGIDTPETAGSPQGEECYADEATARARALLSDTQVVLQSDATQADTDAYNRILAYVTMADGRDFGTVMIAEGYAREFTYDAPYQNQTVYQNAEAAARSAGLGVWACEA